MKSLENPEMVSDVNCFERLFEKNTYSNLISQKKLLINTILNSFVELSGALCSIKELQ
jgi:hypothetical protein